MIICLATHDYDLCLIDRKDDLRLQSRDDIKLDTLPLSREIQTGDVQPLDRYESLVIFAFSEQHVQEVGNKTARAQNSTFIKRLQALPLSAFHFVNEAFISRQNGFFFA